MEIVQVYREKVRQYRWPFLLSLIVGYGFSPYGLIWGIITKQMFDAAFVEDYLALRGYMIAFVVYIGAIVVNDYQRIFVKNKVLTLLDRDVSNYFREKVEGLPVGRYEAYKGGKLINLQKHIGTVTPLFYQVLTVSFSLLGLVIGSFYVLFYLHWKLYLVMLVLAPVPLIFKKITGVLQEKSAEIFRQESDNNDLVAEVVQGLEVVKSFTMEEKILQRYSEMIGQVADRKRQKYALDVKLRMIQSFYRVLISSIFPVVGGYLLLRGEISPGTMIAAGGIFGGLIGRLSHTLQTYQDYQSGKPVISELSQLFQEAEEGETAGQGQVGGQVSGQVSDQVSDQVGDQVSDLESVGGERTGSIVARPGVSGTERVAGAAEIGCSERDTDLRDTEVWGTGDDGAGVGTDRGSSTLSVTTGVQQAVASAFEEIPYAVELKGVTFGYEAGQQVLKDVHVGFPQNQVTALVGKSGSGKSTLFKLICGYYPPDQGQVRFFGEQVSLESARRMIGLVPQQSVLFPVTIAENIGYGKESVPAEDEIREAARAVNGEEFILRQPEGYQTLLTENGANLSGGQQQMVALARAYLKDASIVLFDEPTASQDPVSKVKIEQAIRRLADQQTVVVIAHSISTVQMADQIVVLDQGEVVEVGSYQELLAKQGHFYQLYQKGEL